jgi:hypothetical protein
MSWRAGSSARDEAPLNTAADQNGKQEKYENPEPTLHVINTSSGTLHRCRTQDGACLIFPKIKGAPFLSKKRSAKESHDRR